MRCTPLTVEVHQRKDIEADVDDNGFQPRIIRIDEGNSVMWRWGECSIPHQVREVKYSHKTQTLVPFDDGYDSRVPTKSGEFRREFK